MSKDLGGDVAGHICPVGGSCSHYVRTLWEHLGPEEAGGREVLRLGSKKARMVPEPGVTPPSPSFFKKIRYYFMYTFGQVKVTFLAYNSTSFDKHIQRCNHHHNQELFSSSLNPPGTFAVSPSLLTPRPWQPLSCFCVCWCGF